MIQSLRKRQKKMNNNNNDSNTMEALPKHHYWNFNQRIQFSEKQKNVRKWINVCEKKLSSVLIYSSFESVTKELFEYVFNANIQTYLPDGITQL